MSSRIDHLQGHAYAPGFEPGIITQILDRMTSSDMIMLGAATLACCAFAAYMSPNCSVSRLMRRRRKKAAAQMPEHRADLSEELRLLRKQRTPGVAAEAT